MSERVRLSRSRPRSPLPAVARALDARGRRGRAGRARPRSSVAPAGGQRDAAAVALEQPHAELGLERPDLLAHARLGEVQPLGGAAEVQLLGDRRRTSGAGAAPWRADDRRCLSQRATDLVLDRRSAASPYASPPVEERPRRVARFRPFDTGGPVRLLRARARRAAGVLQRGARLLGRHALRRHPRDLQGRRRCSRSENTQAPYKPRPAEVQACSTTGELHAPTRASRGRQPPDHTRLRGFIKKAFTPRRVAVLEPQIRELDASMHRRASPAPRPGRPRAGARPTSCPRS